MPLLICLNIILNSPEDTKQEIFDDQAKKPDSYSTDSISRMTGMTSKSAATTYLSVYLDTLNKLCFMEHMQKVFEAIKDVCKKGIKCLEDIQLDFAGSLNLW